MARPNRAAATDEENSAPRHEGATGTRTVNGKIAIAVKYLGGNHDKSFI